MKVTKEGDAFHIRFNSFESAVMVVLMGVGIIELVRYLI